METSIRKATADDYGPLCELFNEVDALHRDHLPRIFQLPNGPAREKDYFLGLIADESVALLVAEANGQLVGYVHAVVRDAPAVPFFVPGAMWLWMPLLCAPASSITASAEG